MYSNDHHYGQCLHRRNVSLTDMRRCHTEVQRTIVNAKSIGKESSPYVKYNKALVKHCLASRITKHDKLCENNICVQR